MSGGEAGLDRLEGSRVAIWGAGVEGLEVARAALERDACVVFVDDRFTQLPMARVDGTDLPVLSPAALGDRRFDYVVRSPGVSVYRDELSAAIGGGARITSATEMWLEDFSGSRIVAVTGSKGKTTTAWLAALALEACGLDVGLGGNMGTPLTAFYGQPLHQVYVVEVSSYQGADVRVSPPVGVLTLLAEDHLTWHRGYQNYVRDKLNLFDHRPDIRLAVNAASAQAIDHTSRYPGRVLYGTEGRITAGAQFVLVGGERYIDAARVPTRGDHNIVNLCGALTACELCGETLPDPDALAANLEKMPQLPSRLQTVAVVAGVEFVNDALASNPAGTIAALRTFAGRKVSLIAGGEDRGVDLGPLVQEIARCDPPPTLVCISDLGSRLQREVRRALPALECVFARGMREAVSSAAQLAARDAPGPELGAGPVVLFSPAAPTPVVEGTYLQRGAAFDEAVSELRRAEA